MEKGEGGWKDRRGDTSYSVISGDNTRASKACSRPALEGKNEDDPNDSTMHVVGTTKKHPGV